MADILEALKFGWDAPYRFLASILGIGGAFAVFGPWGADGPIEFLGAFGGWLNINDAPRLASQISAWLTSHQPAVGITAFVLFFAGAALNTAFNERDRRPRRHWRSASTAILALAVIQEVSPGEMPSIWISVGVLVALALAVAFTVGRAGSGELGAEMTGWLIATAENFIVAFLYALAAPAWLFASSKTGSSRT